MNQNKNKTENTFYVKGYKITYNPQTTSTNTLLFFETFETLLIGSTLSLINVIGEDLHHVVIIDIESDSSGYGKRYTVQCPSYFTPYLYDSNEDLDNLLLNTKIIQK